MKAENQTHLKIIEILEDGEIHSKYEFKSICSYDGLRGRISELNRWGYVIRRVDELGHSKWNGDYFRLITIPIRETINEVISIDLIPNKLGKIEIVPLGDIHYGNPCFTEMSEEKLDGYIKYILNNDGVYTILMGDLIESANERATFKIKVTPQEQYEWVYNKLEPLAKADKIIAIISGNHECLDKDTEILTKDGWKKYCELTKSDKVLTIGKDNLLEWNVIEDIHIYDYNGKLNYIENNHIDTKITDNHKLFYWTRSGFKNNQSLSSKEFSKMIDSKSRYILPVSSTFDLPDNRDISDNEIALSAVVLCEGYKNKNGYYFIYQSGEKADIVEKLLYSNKYKYGKQSRERSITEICGKKLKSIPKIQYTFNISKVHSKRLNELVGNKEYPSWVNTLSDRQFDIFVKWMVFSDGSIHPSSDTSLMFYQSDIDFINKFQISLVTHGYRTSISEYRNGEYRLNITKNYGTSIDNILSNTTKVDYDDKIWCITVDNHNFLVRRNGKCHFTGNSWVMNDKGFDIIKTMSMSLKVPYLGDSGYVGIKVGKQFYTIYAIHPRTAVTKKSSKIKMLEDLGSIHDVDIVMCGHIHSIITEEQMMRKPNFITGNVNNKKQLLIATGAFLEYGDYAEQSRYKPEKMGAPKVKLYSDKFDMHVGK